MEHVTLEGVPDGLLVNDIDTKNSANDGLWKVSYVHDDIPYAITDLAFMNRVDAERARSVLQPIVDWTLPMASVARQLRERGWTHATVAQLMMEAMRW